MNAGYRRRCRRYAPRKGLCALRIRPFFFGYILPLWICFVTKVATPSDSGDKTHCQSEYLNKSNHGEQEKSLGQVFSNSAHTLAGMGFTTTSMQSSSPSAEIVRASLYTQFIAL